MSAEYNRAVPPSPPAPDPDLAPPRPWPRRVLPAILAAGFLLRVAGLSYGLPDWVYHSDTPKQLQRVIPFLRGDLVPEDTYPVLHMYLSALLLRLGALVDPHGPAETPSWSQVVVLARLVNAALGTATVGVLALAARRLFGARVGLLAASLLALSPVSIVHAHYEMGDVGQTFFVVAAFFAAAIAYLTGAPLGFLAAGALAGLAASAKFFGVVVFATVLVALTGNYRPSPRRGALLVAGAGLLTGLAFVLSTPLALVEPGRWLAQVRQSPELFLGVPLDSLARLWLGFRAVVGLALEWYGVPLGLAALAGVIELARRHRRGWLTLTTPLVVLAVYVWFRPHGLDDRYLVILAPFLSIGTAVALSRLARWSRPAALVTAVALLALTAVDALHVAYLFWTDDTRELALRWRQRALPPDARPIALPEYGRGDAGASPLFMTDTQSDDRSHVWYSAQRIPAQADAFARLERNGKLLRRFELLPRGFIAPTISYYDLESMRVPFAFPPPDDAASNEDVVFVDPDAVPDRTTLVATPGHARAWTIVSRTPLPRITLALSGEGRVRVRWGLRSRAITLEPRRPTLVEVSPWRGFPWFKHFYRLGIEPGEGRVAVRFLRTPCEVAEQLSAREDWPGAVRQLEACRGARWMEPARLLDLAGARGRAGDADGARAALGELERTAPGLLDGLVALAARPDGDAWHDDYLTLVGRARILWFGHTFRGEAETSPARIGDVVEDATARGGQLVRARAGATPAGVLKVWLPQHFLRGRYLATFRVRGAGASPGPLARLEVLRHLPGRGYERAASRDWAPARGAGAWEDVVLPFATDVEPVDVELQVRYEGRGTLDVDGMTVVPDVRAALAERLAVLVPLRAAR